MARSLALCDKSLREVRKQPMSTFVTSDQRFGHAWALALYRRLFASIAEIDRHMIDRWNSVVRPEDEVWHLGDFAIRQRPARVASLLKALHGRKRCSAARQTVRV